MQDKQKLSTTYKILRAFGFNYSEEAYGQVSLAKVVGKFFRNIWVKRLEMMMDWPILQPLAPRKVRAMLLRRIGCHVGKDVFIGEYVRVDIWHADHIHIEDGVSIAAGSRLLCHQRDFGPVRRGPHHQRRPEGHGPAVRPLSGGRLQGRGGAVR